MRVRFVLAGNESIGYECLKTLIEENQQVVGVVTDKMNEETKLKNARIKFLANQAGIKVYEPEDVNDSAFLEELRLLDLDLIFNIAFLQLYKAPILSIPKFGCINFHPGPLPKYGGSNGWVWAIINGESEYGVTFHYMAEKIDAGDVIAIERFPIETDETGLSLLLKCYKYGAVSFRRVLRNILEGTVVSASQDLRQKSYYYNRTPYDGMINTGWNAAKICDFVRALNFSPFPSPLSPAMVAFKGIKLTVTKAEVLGNAVREKPNPGEVIDITEDGLTMQTGNGAVLLRLSDHSTPSADTARLCVSKGIAVGSVLG
ncbi:MAG TPA: hypothetical protein DCP92_12380 [Nitrospiraceae bacterium]|jgi:methionyl-tRNA formyltransferase|nr:hypothetical protein [Nitrospiraceae bacterium]